MDNEDDYDYEDEDYCDGERDNSINTPSALRLDSEDMLSSDGRAAGGKGQ